MNQIKIKEYAWDFLRKGYEVTAYGISFAEKECSVMGKNLRDGTYSIDTQNSSRGGCR